MDKRFVFRGNAVGLAGHIRQPHDRIIWVQGASALPVIGGYSQSCEEQVECGKLLSADRVRTQATGDFNEREQAYTTLANSVVKGLVCNKRLTADSLEATLFSSHPADGREPSIVPTGTSIVNLRLDGYPVDVRLDTDLFTKYSTKESLTKAYASDESFYKLYRQRFSATATDKKLKQRQIAESGGYIITSLVSEIQTKHPKAVVAGNTIRLEGFGVIIIGELLITNISRRLSLLQVELGSLSTSDCPPDCWPVGVMMMAEVESNGSVII